MDAQLQAVRQDLRAASQRLDRLLKGLSDEGWRRRPQTGSWSAAECVAHLNITHEAYLPRLRTGLEAVPTSGERGSGRLRKGPLGWMFGRMVGPLPRVAGRRRGRVKAPAAFVPGGELPRSEVVERFRTLQSELMEFVEACEGRPIDGVRIQSPFVESVSFNLFATLVIIARHQHRHLQQAEEAAGGTG
ncbi:MAG: DinB family protein [Gemmatimonadales bacterium]|nr:MAG: DinB family protein [Gemmatimonadales bacterium]